MHDDAELAMVGVNRAGVEVSDLGDRKRRQQDEAEARDDRQQIEPAAVLSAEERPNCFQFTTSSLPRSLTRTSLFYRRTAICLTIFRQSGCMVA
jgi:hypothetical protein